MHRAARQHLDAFLAKFFDSRVVPRLREGLGWTLAAVAAGFVCFPVFWAHSSYWDEPLMIIFWRTSLGVFFFCVVAAAVTLPTVAWTWPLRPIRYLGEVSYGIYLWHLFAIAICLQAGLAPMPMLVAALGLTIATAALSWHTFEKPILRLGRRFDPRVARPQAAAG